MTTYKKGVSQNYTKFTQKLTKLQLLREAYFTVVYCTYILKTSKNQAIIFLDEI